MFDASQNPEERSLPSITEELLSVAAHELRTPLTTLLAQLELIQLSSAKPIGTQDYSSLVASCLRQAHRLANLVGELTDFTSVRQGMVLNYAVADLTQIVTETIEQVQVSSPRAAPILLFARGPVLGRWDSERLVRVVTNLLSNALKYGGGQEVEVKVSADTERGVARVSVNDRGIGIPHEMQDRIFNRFERISADPSVAGLGIGLFVARQITEAHGGRITVASEPGHGSTFAVELPMGTEEPKGDD